MSDRTVLQVGTTLNLSVMNPGVNLVVGQRELRDARDWQNPYLMVQPNGIDARPISAATEVPSLSPREVVGYLEKLPSIAWPYGLVAAVQENGVRAPGDRARIKRNREELVRLLEKAGVKVDLWPSA